MKNTTLNQLSVEDLQKQQKLLKITTGILIGMSVVMAGAILYLIIQKGFTMVPILLTLGVSTLLTVLFTNKKNLDDIRTEIVSRQTKV